MQFDPRSVRETLVLSQREIAAKVDLAISTIQTFENGWDGRANFSARTRRKLAEAYRVSIDEINAACSLKEPTAA